MDLQQRNILLLLTTAIGVWLSCRAFESSHWDYLVFTQTWPITLCIKNSENRTARIEDCLFPRDSLMWTIHGLWPSRTDGDNPSYCNGSAKFDESKIEDIKVKLEQFWPNLMKGETVDSLWKHEWEKHGTCALDFEPLNNEKKYFQKGLDLYGLYNMTELLFSLKILPENNKEYSAIYILNGIKKAFSKAPHLECFEKTNTKPIYLLEIRLCFDKSLELMDCPNTICSSRSCDHDCIIYPKNVAHRGAP